MTPELAAILAMLATGYLACGAGYALLVGALRVMLDEPVRLWPLVGLALIWPLDLVRAFRA